MAAGLLTVGHGRTITDAQTAAHTGAEGAEARLRPASVRLVVKMQPVSAGASLPLLFLRWGSDEVGAAGSILHREEERAVAATLHRGAPVLLSLAASALFAYNAETQRTVQTASISLEGRSLLSVSPLVLRVHGEEAKHHQVQEGPDDSQPHQDVHEAERHVGRFLLEVLLLLQGHKVPEANSGECDEGVVVGVEEAPSLKVGEGYSPNAQCSNAGQESHQDHVLHGHLSATTAQALLRLM